MDHHSDMALVKASCSMIQGKTISAHRIQLRLLSTYFNFLGYVTLQLLISFISSRMWNFFPSLGHCFVPSGSCRVLSLKNCKYNVWVNIPFKLTFLFGKSFLVKRWIVCAHCCAAGVLSADQLRAQEGQSSPWGQREQPSHASLPKHGHHCLPRGGQGCAEGSCVSPVMSLQRNLLFLWLCERERLLAWTSASRLLSTLWRALSGGKKNLHPDQ